MGLSAWTSIKCRKLPRPYIAPCNIEADGRHLLILLNAIYRKLPLRCRRSDDRRVVNYVKHPCSYRQASSNGQHPFLQVNDFCTFHLDSSGFSVGTTYAKLVFFMYDPPPPLRTFPDGSGNRGGSLRRCGMNVEARTDAQKRFKPLSAKLPNLCSFMCRSLYTVHSRHSGCLLLAVSDVECTAVIQYDYIYNLFKAGLHDEN